LNGLGLGFLIGEEERGWRRRENGEKKEKERKKMN